MSAGAKFINPSSSVIITTGGSARWGYNNNIAKMVNKPNAIDDEYNSALRTKSSRQLWYHVQVNRKTTTTVSRHNDKSLSSPRPPMSTYAPIFRDYLLKPPQEILDNTRQRSPIHYLIPDYVEASLQACEICGYLLQCIDQARADYCIIKQAIRLSKRFLSQQTGGGSDDDQFQIIFDELSQFTKHNSPLSSPENELQFNSIHDRYKLMLNQLTTKCKRTTRSERLNSFWKKTFSMVGNGLAFVKNGLKKSDLVKKSEAQLDAAAKGVYTLDRELETMSCLVRILCDDIEHEKLVVERCVKNRNKYMWKEVLKEFQMHESRFLEKLGELEDHIYLYIPTINRTTRLLDPNVYL